MNETHASSPAHPEPLSAAEAVAAGIDFAELQVNAHGVFWIQLHPEDGMCRLWRWHAGQAHCLTAPGFSVRSRVYEYGGGAFCLAADSAIFVNDRDQQLYRQPLDDSAPQALTQEQRRYGGLSFAHGQVLAVEEEGAVHRIVALSLPAGERQVLAEGADFYAAPVVSVDGRRLAWVEWQRPHQPWTSSRLMSAARGDDGQWSAPRCIAGHHDDQSLQQPRFDAQGVLQCLSDRNGFWQPWGESGSGFVPLPAVEADHASAPWQLGSCTWLPLDGGYLACCLDNGAGQLRRQFADGTSEDLSGEFSRFRNLALDEAFIYCIAASGTRPSAVLAISRADQAVQVLAGGVSPLPAAAISRPQALSYPSGGAQAHAFFYPALNAEGPAPLLVFVHGGPTSACYPVFEPRIQFWTQRGFAVVDLNYRGSSGYGRAYRQSLHAQWGVADVEDACAVVGHLAGQGLIDPQRAFIRGGSAGGYTVLCALAFHEVFRGGASHYGVSDPLALSRATHKFEGDYLDWLIGDPHTEVERYHARTPLLHAGRIKVPVIFFQGELDAVVVPAQTRDMLDAVQAQGIAAEGHFYPDERHGFRQPANQADALEKEWQFYRNIMAPRP